MQPATIIIVSFNTSAELEACLRSIAKWVSRADADVVVVDNNSKDGSPEMVRRAFPWVKLLENSDNEGFGRANNRALRACATPFVLLLNPDTVLVGDPVAPFLRFMEEDKTSGIASCLLREADGAPQRTTHVLPNYWTLFLHFSRAKVLASSPFAKNLLSMLRPALGAQLESYLDSEREFAAPRIVETISGAFMFCRREVLAQVEYFDEEFFLYSEDIDLCRRVGEAGWKIHLLPISPVRHIGGRSMEAGCGRFSAVRYRGDFRYFKKHFGPMASVMVPLVSIPPLICTAAAAFVAGALISTRRSASMRTAREALHVAALSLRLAKL